MLPVAVPPATASFDRSDPRVYRQLYLRRWLHPDSLSSSIRATLRNRNGSVSPRTRQLTLDAILLTHRPRRIMGRAVSRHWRRQAPDLPVYGPACRRRFAGVTHLADRRRHRQSADDAEHLWQVMSIPAYARAHCPFRMTCFCGDVVRVVAAGCSRARSCADASRRSLVLPICHIHPCFLHSRTISLANLRFRAGSRA